MRVFVALALILLPNILPSLADNPNHQIEIADFSYSIEDLSVNIGDIIEWVNRDIVPHTATAVDKSWDTGLIAPGKSVLFEVKVGMASDYFCFYHPMMKAKIILIE